MAMAAFVLRRKIIEESIDVTDTAQLCTFQCDPHDNPTGFCFAVCAAVCPSFCSTKDSSPAPSSLPPESTIFTLDTPHRHSSLSLPLKISLAVLVATFSLFLLYTIYKSCTVWYQSRRRRRRRTAPPPSPENRDTHDEFLDHPVWYIRTVGLQPSAIGAITVVKFTKSDGPVEASFCPVCLSEFQENEMLRLLPKCDHAFHIACIDTWLSSHTNCPLCRAGIVKNPANSPSPEQNVEDSGRSDETHVGISIPEAGFAGESQTEDGVESSGLRIGEEHLNGVGEFLIMRRSVSLDDLASSRVRFDVVHNYSHSIDGDLGIELVKIDHITDSRGV